MINNFKSINHFLQNKIYLPKGLADSGEFKVLHLSDTPSLIYPAIEDMLNRLKPDLIVHTGDIADDIKLEDNPGCLGLYQRTVEPFLQNLIQNTPRFYIVPGNHDSVPFIEAKVPASSIVNPGLKVDIEGYSFGMAHYLSDLPRGAQYNLFGHNFEMPEVTAGDIFLNGAKSINIILLPSGEVYGIRYPGRTNHGRRYRNNPPNLI